MNHTRRFGVALVLAAATLVAASCANDPIEIGEPTTAEPSTTTAATASSIADEPESEWEKVVAPEPCECSDGSEFSYYVREADPTKVVFFLNGGGACFSAETCAGADPTFTQNLSEETEPDEGIFALDNDANPLADYSMVYVPYCTGDLHLGTQSHDYGDGVVVEHKGRVNATTALATAAERFPNAERVVVAGSSAGSASAALYGGLAADEWPDADLAVFADASAAYPGTPEITTAIGSLWGIANDLPTWPTSAGLTAADWSLHALFWNTAAHAPQARFASYNNAYDEVQAAFTGMIGLDPTQLLELIDETNQAIIDRGVDLVTWIAPGIEHTILRDDDLYTQSVEGSSLIEWVSNFVAGDPVSNVRCSDCEAPA